MRVTRRQTLRGGGALCAGASLASITGCLGSRGDTSSSGDGTAVTIGSKSFTENVILGYMAYEAITATTDVPLVDETRYGGSSAVWGGLLESALDLYWDYTGTIWSFYPPQHESSPSDPATLYDEMKTEIRDEHGLEALDRGLFDNTYALLASPEWMDKTGVRSISDLAEHVNSGNIEDKIVLGEGFFGRSDGWPGLADYYGFEDDALAAWEDNIEVVDSGLTYEFLRTDMAAVGMGFATNPQILVYGLETLDDDENFFPVYNPVPIGRKETFEKHPEIRTVLSKIGPALKDNETMQALNKQVALDGADPQVVAREFLTSEGVI
ncbi:glycine betaine ABC transporter substrate-binding protein [Haloferax elongans]|nr:glycine betaine ABC transporter substrate-binding protein [Haloferax elongans]